MSQSYMFHLLAAMCTIQALLQAQSLGPRPTIVFTGAVKPGCLISHDCLHTTECVILGGVAWSKLHHHDAQMMSCESR